MISTCPKLTIGIITNSKNAQNDYYNTIYPTLSDCDEGRSDGTINRIIYFMAYPKIIVTNDIIIGKYLENILLGCVSELDIAFWYAMVN